MQCTSPITIDGRLLPCGRCIACRIAKTREWSFRIVAETNSWSQSSFLTLTYNTEHLPYRGDLVKAHLQLFIKRLRMEISPRKMKYYACGEYGETNGRPHYHMIAFGIGPEDEDLIKDAWPNGFIDIGTVTRYSAQYVAGYIFDKYSGKIGGAFGHYVSPFQLCSNGLGKQWLIDNKAQVSFDMGVRVEGRVQTMPRYYRKLFGEEISEDDFEQRRLAAMVEAKERRLKREATSEDVLSEVKESMMVAKPVRRSTGSAWHAARMRKI